MDWASKIEVGRFFRWFARWGFLGSMMFHDVPWCSMMFHDVPWCSMLVFIGAGNHGKNAGNHIFFVIQWWKVTIYYLSRFATGTARTQWIGQRGKKRARGGVKLGHPWPKLGRTRANLNLGLTCAELRPVGSNLTCATWSWGHLAPKLPPRQAQCGQPGHGLTPKGPNLWQQLCNKLGPTRLNGQHCSTRSIIDTKKTWKIHTSEVYWASNVPRVEPMSSSTWAEVAAKLAQLAVLDPSWAEVGAKWGPCRIETLVVPICKIWKLRRSHAFFGASPRWTCPPSRSCRIVRIDRPRS